MLEASFFLYHVFHYYFIYFLYKTIIKTLTIQPNVKMSKHLTCYDSWFIVDYKLMIPCKHTRYIILLSELKSIAFT